MRKSYKIHLGLLLILTLTGSRVAVAQYSQFQLGDTTKPEYPYIFPILGSIAYDKGFDLPYPAGIMVNYFYGQQDILIPDISVGFSEGLLPDIPLTDVTSLVEFEHIQATATSINIRPDLWVFPFLNVYGIFGKTWATTDVMLSYPITLKAVAELEGTSFGTGITGASGLGKYFFVLDGNWVWTNMTNFEEPVKTSTFSFRLGRAFPMGKNPQSNVAFWLGGMRIRMGGVTEGTITLGEVLPPETWDKRTELVAAYREWYDDQNPLNKQLADRTLTPIVNALENSNGEGTVAYSITKKPAQEWNIIIGGQYQINKRFQLRTEGGIIGNRKSFLLSGNYRFGF